MTTPYLSEQPTTQMQKAHSGAPTVTSEPAELPEAEKQAIEAVGEYVTVPIGDLPARVKPQLQWRMSDMRLLNQGDLDGWAEAVIHPDDLDAFMDRDLTMAEFQDFAADAARLAGDGLGKSSARSRSSRNTQRR
jgi:hypothetical protein